MCKCGNGAYEVTVNGTTTTQKSYVDGIILNSRTLISGTQSASDTHYLHTDHLGSVETTTDALEKFVNRMSFGAWGERQKSDWKPGSPVENFLTTNGYTGHNQLDSHNLIHMGGRVYDPNLGRFLSADIYIQAPYDTQNYNRYSYVGNNPLSYIDPSGYSKSRSFHPSQQDFAHAMQRATNGCDSNSCTTVGQRPGRLTGDAAYNYLRDLSNSLQWTTEFAFSQTGITEAFNASIDTYIAISNNDYSAVPPILVGAAVEFGSKKGKMLEEVAEKAKDLAKKAKAAEKKSADSLKTGTTDKSSKIDRKAFKSERTAYWKKEANENTKKYSAENIERMKKGKAPIGSDGHPMELHHVNRTIDSELAPMTRTEHRLGENYKKNHP